MRTAALVVALALPAGAGAEGVLDAYALALKADPRLAIASFEQEASEKARRAALAGLLPTITADVERTHERQNILSSQNLVIGTGESSFGIQNWSVTITQPLLRLAAVERLRQADAAQRQFIAQRASAMQALMVRTATAYLAVLAARDNFEFATAERVAVGRQLEVAKERVARGLATVVNLHDSQARFAQTEAQEVEARNLLDDAEQAMREITGKPLSSYRPLKQEIPISRPNPEDPATWLEAAFRQNPGLEAKREAVQVAQQEVRRQRAGHVPTLNLVGAQNNRRQGGTLFGGGSHVETTDVSLRLAIPIYEGGMTNAVTEEAAARHGKAVQELELEHRLLERQTRAAYQGVVGAMSRVQALRQGVVSQQSALQAKQESFRSGLLTLLAVLDAERDLYLVRRDYARARYDYLMNGLRLKQAAGAISDVDMTALDRLLN